MSEVSAQTLTIALPVEKLTDEPLSGDTPGLGLPEAAPAIESQPDQIGEQKSPFGIGHRLAAIAYATGHFLFNGGKPAEAAPSHMAAQEAQAVGIIENNLGSLAILATIVGTATGVVAFRWQTRQKKHDNFIKALEEVAGASDEAKLQARIDILRLYAEDPVHKANVFITASQYLIARRAVIINERKRLKAEGMDPAKWLDLLDDFLSLRRNADREMVKLLVATRPAAIERKRTTAPSAELGIIRRFIGHIAAGREGARKKEEQKRLEDLRRVTGLLPTRNEELVDDEGLCLDLLRDVAADCDLSGIDFTGAGIQGNNFFSVIFENCDFGEAQLEGTTMLGCDFSGANFQAAYFTGDPADPYFTGSTVFRNCVVDGRTKFGRRPENHPKARHLSNHPTQPDELRGGGKITLQGLTSHTLSDGQIVTLVKQWQMNGLVLAEDSDLKYFLNPPSKPPKP